MGPPVRKGLLMSRQATASRVDRTPASGPAAGADKDVELRAVRTLRRASGGKAVADRGE